MKHSRTLYCCLVASLVMAPLVTFTPLFAQELHSGKNGSDSKEMAYGRFVPERQDDFAWENDKVAFRVYGPSSGGKGQVSGVDAWLKKVP
mgnify:CR=1 FL=1